MARMGLIGVKLFAVAIATFLAIAYLKLGYFLVVVLPLSAGAAVYATRRQLSGFSPWLSVPATVLAFCLVTAAVWSLAIRQHSESRELTWEVVPSPGSGSPEVWLELGGGHTLGSRSPELAAFLQERSDPSVIVHLPIRRTLGCFQSLGPPNIEGFRVAPLGPYKVTGSGPGPWTEHWWCP